MTKKKTKKAVEKKITKKPIKKFLIKRIDDIKDDPKEDSSKSEPFDKVKTEIVINNGVVLVNPIFNPFDENNKD